MASEDSCYRKEINGKWFYAGTFFHQGVNGEFVPGKEVEIELQHREREYIVHIGLTMLSAPGGDFDDDDTVYADIYSVDDLRTTTGGTRRIDPPDEYNHDGGVWEHHFGNYGDDTNEGISAFVGRINQKIKFRLFVQGDDWAGASYTIMEL